MLWLSIATAVVYVVSLMDRSGAFELLLFFYPSRIMRGEVWRLISWVVLPSSGSLWLLISLYFYYFIGSTLENVWGAGRFTAY